MKDAEIKKVVREGYARVAKQETSCCGPSACCTPPGMSRTISKEIGYSDRELEEVPDGANLGLGCGNPVALASLKEGEVVLDLGSGAGFDAFLAANRVGDKGRVIGVDMTPEMIAKARENAKKGKYRNVEFRLGEIEKLPVADASVDAVISNCVINLSPDKKAVFSEAFRALRPGGRVMVSDIVLLKELPEPVLRSVEAYVGCIAGAIGKDEYVAAMKSAGFKNIRIAGETSFPLDLILNDPTARAVVQDLGMTAEQLADLAKSVVSIKVQAAKPA